MQTLWFVIQCIARRLEHLPMTQLEITTLAYASMTVAIYAFWWHKPLNITCPIRVPISESPECSLFEGADSTSIVAAVGGILLFGGVHFAAWNYQFPTTTETHLWRISAIAITGIPFAMAVMTILSFMDKDWPSIVRGLWYTLITLTFTAYVAARLILFSLSFSTLRMVPHEVYQTVAWTQLIPHI